MRHRHIHERISKLASMFRSVLVLSLSESFIVQKSLFPKHTPLTLSQENIVFCFENYRLNDRIIIPEKFATNQNEICFYLNTTIRNLYGTFQCRVKKRSIF